MTGGELREQVGCIIADKASTLQMYLILKVDQGYVLRRADIEEEEAMPALKMLFKENLYETIVKNQELEIRKLSVDDEVPGAVYAYDYDVYSEELNLIKDFNIIDAVKIDKFNFDKDDVNKLFGFIIYIGTMEKGLTLFKKHYPIALIKRDSFLLGAVKSKKRFEKVSGNDILRINSDWQLIRISGEIIVRDLSILEKSLGFTTFIKEAANKAIVSIQELDVISNIDALSGDVENLTYARKLAMIQKSSAVFSKKISREVLIEFTKNSPALKNKFRYDYTGKKILLSTQAEKKAFLRLLNDDFLQSLLTSEYYTVHSKDRLNTDN